MARQLDRIEIPPPTPEQQRQMHEALKRIKVLRKALLADRGGRSFGSVTDDIAASREERERSLP